IKITGPDDLEWKLKRVVVQSQTFKGAHFSNGILIVDFPLNSDPDAIEARAEIIAKALRK
ncbi:MAG TPA: hypothetical protein VFV50_16205, partial [Bdellovibrionales bacterium]|nr:hypothetical protein [Bdellovibrionales bacterium]